MKSYFIILFVWFLIGFGFVNSQVLVIDSSFGFNGVVGLQLATSGGTNNAKFHFWNKNEIIVNHGNLIHFLDKMGMHLNKAPIKNPDSTAVWSEIYEFLDSKLLGDKLFIQYSYVPKRGGGIQSRIRGINLLNFQDSSIGRNGVIELNNFYYNSIVFNTTKGNELFIVYDLPDLKLDSRLIKSLRLSMNGDSIIFTPELNFVCEDEAVYLTFTSLIKDDEDLFYIGVESLCSNRQKFSIFKFDDAWTFDKQFGKDGTLEISDYLSTLGGKYNFSNIYLLNHKLYVFFDDWLNNSVLVLSINEDGTVNKNFGNGGKIELTNCNLGFQRQLVTFDSVTNSILILTNNIKNKTSELFSFFEDGTINPYYKINGGIKLNGNASHFHQISNDEYLVYLPGSFLPFQLNTVYKLVRNELFNSLDFEKSGYHITHWVNSSGEIFIQWEGLNEVNRLIVKDLLGRHIHSFYLNNIENYIKLQNNFPVGIYILELHTRYGMSYVEPMLVIDPK